MSFETEQDEPSDRGRRILKIAGLGLVCACWLGVFLSVWVHVDRYQWDFQTYWDASRAFDRGLDPYQVTHLAQVGGPNSQPFPFVYPLTALVVMRPLARLDYATAYRVWLLIKIASLIGLLLLWKHEFLRGTDWLWILLITLFAFQAATLWDVKAGNISSIEQLLLWSGFALLLRGRAVAFAALVIGAALFKLTVSVFLVLLLVPNANGRRAILLFVSSCAALTAVTLGSFAGHMDYFRGFLASASQSPVWLQSNPCTFGLAVDLARRYPGVFGASVLIPYALWILASALILVLGRKLIARASRSQTLLSVLVSCFCYALVTPRMVIYSYMILIVPVLTLVVPTVRRLGSIGACAAAALLCIDGLKVLPGKVGILAQDCQPLALLVACWLLLVYADAHDPLAADGHGDRRRDGR